MISAQIIADSISPDTVQPGREAITTIPGSRLTTFKLRYPKMVHGELMTHRVFSRNASSSRAIPTGKLLQDSLDNMYVPQFVKNQRGMQGGSNLIDGDLAASIAVWECLARTCAAGVGIMASKGAHKQHANRPLEWFGWINVLVSSTEFMNFFGLRLDRAAQPEIRQLAEEMWRAWNESKPKLMLPGHWHLPFVPAEDFPTIAEATNMPKLYSSAGVEKLLSLARIVSVARCARISYESFETGKRSTVEEDLKLYNEKIMGGQPFHASPAEHQATPDTGLHFHRIGETDAVLLGDHYSQWGNFTGWRQFRKMVPGEACAPLPEEYRK